MVRTPPRTRRPCVLAGSPSAAAGLPRRAFFGGLPARRLLFSSGDSRFLPKCSNSPLHPAAALASAFVIFFLTCLSRPLRGIVGSSLGVLSVHYRHTCMQLVGSLYMVVWWLKLVSPAWQKIQNMRFFGRRCCKEKNFPPRTAHTIGKSKASRVQNRVICCDLRFVA